MGVVDNVLGTNIFGPNATDRAMGAQKDAADQANATQRYIFDTQRNDNQPWRQAGLKALAGLEDPNFGKDLTMDPGYQFRLNEGNKAINAGAAARGLGNSGATLKALAKYGQDFAANNSAAQNYGNNVSSNQIGLGNAIASSNIAQANMQGNLLGQGLMFAGMRK
jgi:hypothetical protein